MLSLAGCFLFFANSLALKRPSLFASVRSNKVLAWAANSALEIRLSPLRLIYEKCGWPLVSAADARTEDPINERVARILVDFLYNTAFSKF